MTVKVFTNEMNELPIKMKFKKSIKLLSKTIKDDAEFGKLVRGLIIKGKSSKKTSGHKEFLKEVARRTKHVVEKKQFEIKTKDWSFIEEPLEDNKNLGNEFFPKKTSRPFYIKEEENVFNIYSTKHKSGRMRITPRLVNTKVSFPTKLEALLALLHHIEIENIECKTDWITEEINKEESIRNNFVEILKESLKPNDSKTETIPFNEYINERSFEIKETSDKYFKIYSTKTIDGKIRKRPRLISNFSFPTRTEALKDLKIYVNANNLDKELDWIHYELDLEKSKSKTIQKIDIPVLKYSILDELTAEEKKQIFNDAMFTEKDFLENYAIEKKGKLFNCYFLKTSNGDLKKPLMMQSGYKKLVDAFDMIKENFLY
jgi:hypothetical protein